MCSTELILQVSREEPIQVISKPCDAGSVQHEAMNVENVKSQILKVDEEVILSKSSIADEFYTKVPTLAGTSNPSSPKHNHTQTSFIESFQYRQAICFMELVPNAPGLI